MAAISRLSMELSDNPEYRSTVGAVARTATQAIDATNGTRNDAVADNDIDEDDPASYPEGGTEAWLVVLGAWCAMIPSMGLLNTLAILQAWVSEHELAGTPESTVGWIFSTYAFFLYFTGAQTGPIFDAYPVRLLVIPGSIGMVLSIFLFSISKEFYQYLLSFGVLGGISASLLFNPSISAVGHWFHRRRALATGIACTAGGLGGVAFPLIILYAAPRVGFGWALRIVGFLCAVAGVAASCLLRKRLLPPPDRKASTAVDLGALRSEPRFAATALATFLVEFAVFIPYTYVCSHAVHAGLDRQTAYLLNALLNAGAVPGRALPGYVADRFGPFNVMCGTALACVATIFGLWYTVADGGSSSSMAQQQAVISFAPLFGFWSGAAISLTPVCIGRVCRTADYGKRSGTAFFLASFGALVGVPIAGAIIERQNGSYRGLVLFAGGLYLAAFIAFAFARGLCTGWRVAAIF